MRVLILTQGQHTVVDDDVYEWASKTKWAAQLGHNGLYYAMRTTRQSGRRTIYLAREILKSTPGMKVDHVNGDTLNNLRSNLRECSTAQNTQNSRLPRTNTTGYRGISWCKRARKWKVQIRCNGNREYVGLFPLAIDAAFAYDQVAIERHKGFARLNFPFQ